MKGEYDIAQQHRAGQGESSLPSVRSSGCSFPTPFLWPLIMTAAVGNAATNLFTNLAANFVNAVGGAGSATEPEWTTDNTVALELPSMRLRHFSAGKGGRPTLICAPYALHGATIADFAPRHSLVEVLCRSGLSRVFVTDWRSATREMRFFSIDSYLADLNVAIDEFKSPVDLVGLCQGGWLSLLYAARFPHKVRRLVLAGAPIDFHAGDASLSRIVASTPFSLFESLVQLGDGRVAGRHVVDAWGPSLDAGAADRVLQITPGRDAGAAQGLEARFRDWYARTVDLPGSYYLQTVQRLYKENQIAKGQFVALGRRIDLADVHAPLFLLAARDDELVAPEQLFSATSLVGSDIVETATEPCGHLSLFLGAKTLTRSWTRIARWLSDERFAIAG